MQDDAKFGLVDMELMKALAKMTGKFGDGGWDVSATVGDLQRLGVRAIRLRKKIEDTAAQDVSAADDQPESDASQ